MSPETLAQAKALQTEEAGATPPDTTQEDTIPAKSDEEGETPKDRGKKGQTHSLLDSLYDSMLDSTSQDEAPEGILKELERYIRKAVIDRKKGKPLKWWKKNSCRFRGQSDLARRYLSCPPSSAQSETVFSTNGNIYNEKHSSLKGDKQKAMPRAL